MIRRIALVLGLLWSAYVVARFVAGFLPGSSGASTQQPLKPEEFQKYSPEAPESDVERFADAWGMGPLRKADARQIYLELGRRYPSNKAIIANLALLK